MFIEERVYQVKPGRIPEYFELYETKGLIPHTRYMKVMLGYYAAEIGNLNEVIHLWAHESLDARDASRDAMRADADFKAYWHEVRELIVAQRTRIMKPAPFFEERLSKLIAAVKPES